MLVFHLNGHVANPVVFQQITLNAAQQAIMVIRRYHLRMQRHQLLFTNLPDVDVVDITYFRNIQAQVFCSLAISTSCGVPSSSSWKLSFSSRQALRITRQDTSTDNIGSIGVQPVVRITIAAAMAPTDPSKSPIRAMPRPAR